MSSKRGAHQEIWLPRAKHLHAEPHAVVLVSLTNAPSFCLEYDMGDVNVMPGQATNRGKSKEDYPMARCQAR